MSADDDRTQIYLITPPDLDLEGFPAQLEAALDAAPIACLRLRMATTDADQIARAADALRLIAHERDVPLVVERHVALAERLGLDGVHLMEGSRGVREARKALGEDAIVGAYCAGSSHDGMTAGEAGADYVSFGPVAEDGLGTDMAPDDLFAWWSQMIELPVVAEGALLGAKGDLARLGALAPVADFVGLGEDLWRQEDPIATLKAVAQSLGY